MSKDIYSRKLYTFFKGGKHPTVSDQLSNRHIHIEGVPDGDFEEHPYACIVRWVGYDCCVRIWIKKNSDVVIKFEFTFDIYKKGQKTQKIIEVPCVPSSKGVPEMIVVL